MNETRKTKKKYKGDKKNIVKFRVCCQGVWCREMDHTHAIKVHDLKLQHATFLQCELTSLRLFHYFFSRIDKSDRFEKERVYNNK